MAHQLILYSKETCSRCKLIKRMLDIHNVFYTEIDDIKIIYDKEFESAPVLEVDGKPLEYPEILTWLQQNNYYSLWSGDTNESNET